MEQDNDSMTEVEVETNEEFSPETMELLAREVDLNTIPAALLD